MNWKSKENKINLINAVIHIINNYKYICNKNNLIIPQLKLSAIAKKDTCIFLILMKNIL